jgi:hypothetical protein
MGARPIAAAAALGLSIAAISPAAHAATFFSGWFTTNFVGPSPGESARVTEGILYDTVAGSAGAPAYDYIFMVANTGTVPIAAFGGGTGAPGANVLYNSDISFGLPGLPASGPVNPNGPLPAFLTQVPPAQAGKRLPGGWGGANNPFLPIVNVTPYTPLYPGAKGLFSPNYQYWGFEVSTTGAGYALGWYNLVGNQLFGGGRVTRFDLNSILGPIPGGAFVDPPISNYIIDWTVDDFLSLTTPSIADPANTFCDTTDPQCSPDIIPTDIVSLNFTGFGDPTPLPGALPLFATGLGALGLLGWRRKRKQAA